MSKVQINNMQLCEENKRLQIHNDKLLKINKALMQRVEEGGNQSAPYATFEHSVYLAEQVREKTLILNETLSQLERSNRQLNTFKQRFTDAIESISEAFVLLDADDKIIFQNNNLKEFLSTANLPPDTLLNLKKLTEKKFNSPNDEDQSQPLKPVFQLPDGRWFQLNERRTEEGGRVLLYTDISALKEAETARYDQAMAQKSLQLQSLVDNLSQGVVLFNSQKQIEVWNNRFVQLSQLTEPQLGDNPSQSQLQELTELDLHAQPDLNNDSTVQILTTGTVLEIRVKQLGDGKIIKTYTDITQRHRYAQSLQENEKRLRLITDNVPAMIAYIGADLKFEFTNQVYIDWYGSSTRGLDISALDKSLNYQQIQPFVKRALNGESVSFESK
ncbi:MAG: PAS domain-containing protein, partial [Psychromonas sp.]